MIAAVTGHLFRWQQLYLLSLFCLFCGLSLLNSPFWLYLLAFLL